MDEDLTPEKVNAEFDELTAEVNLGSPSVESLQDAHSIISWTVRAAASIAIYVQLGGPKGEDEAQRLLSGFQELFNTVPEVLRPHVTQAVLRAYMQAMDIANQKNDPLA